MFCSLHYILLFHSRQMSMASQRIPDELLRNEELIKELERIAKDSLLMHGVLMRIKESPNSSEVNHFCCLFFYFYFCCQSHLLKYIKLDLCGNCGCVCVFQVVSYAPFTLFPSPVPTILFNQALDVATHFNRLIDKVSQSPCFLEDALARYCSCGKQAFMELYFFMTVFFLFQFCYQFSKMYFWEMAVLCACSCSEGY